MTLDAAIKSAMIDPAHPVLKALPPLGLYVHFPWCLKKCPYCDFNSHEVRGEITEEQYIKALIRDLEHVLPQVWGRKVVSIFFGGGTPSLLSAKSVDSLISQFRTLFPLDPFAEITLEANPGTFEMNKFRDFRECGITRLSIGVQSFNDDKLKRIGRVHDSQQAREAAQAARSIFENVNLDLMYALPNQTLDEVEQDLETACRFEPTHLSVYHLTIEPNTFFDRYPPKLPTEDIAAGMQEAVESFLVKRGYSHYEISAFCQPGQQSQHNLNYWRFGDYVGIGAGAHSKISFRDRVLRQTRHKQPKEYMEQVKSGNVIQSEIEILPEERVGEFMMNAMRLTEGFHLGLLNERTGVSMATIQRQLAQAEKLELIERKVDRIRPTLRGQRFLNELLQLFL